MGLSFGLLGPPRQSLAERTSRALFHLLEYFSLVSNTATSSHSSGQLCYMALLELCPSASYDISITPRFSGSAAATLLDCIIDRHRHSMHCRSGKGGSQGGLDHMRTYCHPPRQVSSFITPRLAYRPEPHRLLVPNTLVYPF